MANGDSMIKTKSALIDDSECEPHSIVNMSELLASSAAAYAHKVTAKTMRKMIFALPLPLIIKLQFLICTNPFYSYISAKLKCSMPI